MVGRTSFPLTFSIHLPQQQQHTFHHCASVRITTMKIFTILLLACLPVTLCQAEEHSNGGEREEHCPDAQGHYHPPCETNVESPPVDSSNNPTPSPSGRTSAEPSPISSVEPTASPSPAPSASPSAAPSPSPSAAPTSSPSPAPSPSPSVAPSPTPTVETSASPSPAPSSSPSAAPTTPSAVPSPGPTPSPSGPTPVPSVSLPPSTSRSPSNAPSGHPSAEPSRAPRCTANGGVFGNVSGSAATVSFGYELEFSTGTISEILPSLETAIVNSILEEVFPADCGPLVRQLRSGRHLEVLGVSKNPPDEPIEDIACGTVGAGNNCVVISGQLTLYADEEGSATEKEAATTAIKTDMDNGRFNDAHTNIVRVTYVDLTPTSNAGNSGATTTETTNPGNDNQGVLVGIFLGAGVLMAALVGLAYRMQTRGSDDDDDTNELNEASADPAVV